MTKKNCITCGGAFETAYNQKRFCDPCKITKRKIYALRHPKQRMVSAAKYRAKEESVPFDITEDDFEVPEFCPILGVKLESAVGKGCFRDNSPSLDKIVPSVGYVRGNIIVISAKANRMKSNATPEEISKLAEWLKNNPVSEQPVVGTPLETAAKSGPRKPYKKTEEQRKKLSEAQALRWAQSRSGKIQATVDNAVEQVRAGRSVFIATTRPIGYVTRFKLEGLKAEEVDGGVMIKPTEPYQVYVEKDAVFKEIPAEDSWI